MEVFMNITYQEEVDLVKTMAERNVHEVTLCRKGDNMLWATGVVSEQPKSNPYASVLKELYSDTIINAFPDVPKMYSSIQDSGCAHTWKAYIGFNDSYNYCTKCNAKEKLS